MELDITEIGNLNEGDGDTDSYIKVVCATNMPITCVAVREELYSRYTFRAKYPGDAFCSRLTIMPNPYHDNEAVVIVHNQLDI